MFNFNLNGMKKSLLFSLSLLLGVPFGYSQTTYEVGEGKTYAKLGDVFIDAVIGASSDTEFIINIAEGVYTEGTGVNNVAINLKTLNLGNKKVTIVGAGADKTIIQRREDKLVVVQDVKDVNPGRLFQAPATGEANGLELVCKNITFRNMGQTFTNNNGALIEALGKDQKYTFENCMFQNLISRQGALFFANPTGLNSFTLESCFVEECGSFYRGVCSGLITINAYGGDVTVKNTTFMNSKFSFEDSNTAGGGNFLNPKTGQILHIGNNKSIETEESKVVFENSNIVNSTFNAPIANLGAMLKIVKAGSGSMSLDLKNVISVGNVRLAEGSVDCDLYFDNTQLTPTVISSALNTVRSSIDDSNVETLAGARIDKTLTYNSDGIKFQMDGDLPEIFVNEHGVKYLKFEEPNSIEKETVDIPSVRTSGNLLVVSNLKQGTSIAIYDITGKLIESQSVETVSIEVALAQGVYILKAGDYITKIKL